MTNNGSYTNEPRPRLCHLRRWPDFDGYGFNLHCEKSKPGQYIGKVDHNSPAESAGLRENDRIIEVNYVPIGNENHKQVVGRIKEGVTRNGTKYPEEVILLVVDQDTDLYYKRKNYVVKSSDPNVETIETEIRDGSGNGSDSPQSSNRSIGKNDSNFARETPPQRKPNESNPDYRHVSNFTGPKVTQTKNTDSPAISRTSDPGYEPPEDDEPYRRTPPSASNKDKPKEFPSTNAYATNNINSSPKSPVQMSSSQSSSSANGSTGGLNFQMSAAEYREKLKEQNARKRDPRQNQNMSMKEKHDLIDRL